jgi:hypothetical protein
VPRFGLPPVPETPSFQAPLPPAAPVKAKSDNTLLIVGIVAAVIVAVCAICACSLVAMVMFAGTSY